MQSDIKSLVDRLRRTRLLGEEQLESLAEQSGAESQAEFAEQLVKNRLLSRWQAAVLLAGLDGPFHVGSYQLVEKTGADAGSNTFLARHVLTGHPVMLHFFEPAGSVASWPQIEHVASSLSRLTTPLIVETFETVRLPEYSFVVTAIPFGKPLADCLPESGRLRQTQAARIAAQIALALERLHSAGVAHGNIDLQSIRVTGKDDVILNIDYCGPRSIAIPGANPAFDIEQLGRVLVQLLTGDARPADLSSSLKNEKVHEQIVSFIDGMLNEDPAERPDAAKLARRLSRATGWEPGEDREPAPSLMKFRAAISRFRPESAVLKNPSPVVSAGDMAGTTSSSPQLIDRNRPVETGKRKRTGWKIAAVLSATGIVVVALIYFLMQGLTNESAGDLATSTLDKERPAEVQPVADLATRETGSPEPVFLNQEVVADNGIMLWESPTSGPPVDVRWLPQGPRMIFMFRPNRILAADEGVRILKSAGPGLAAAIDRFESLYGLKISAIERLATGLYLTDQSPDYTAFHVVSLAEPINVVDIETEMGLVPADGLTSSEGTAERLYRGDGFQMAAVEIQSGTTVKTLLIGPEPLMDLAKNSGSVVRVDGALGRVVSMAHDSRLVNIFCVPAAWLNDAGQRMTDPAWLPVNSRLRTMVDESLRAVSLSLHLENGCYLELMLDHSVDTRPAEAERRFKEILETLRGEINDSLANSVSDPWWNRVRMQMDNMFTALFRELRVGIERDVVVGNVWLPEIAPHNLLAGGRIAMDMGVAPAAASVSQAVPTADTTTTFEQVLIRKRDLEVTTNPDLGLLLKGLETEVNDQNPGLQYPFRILLLGNDLAKQGITQNQRPGNFSIVDQPLSEILTQLVFKANPNKTASDPTDPLCELIWVVLDDAENPGRKVVAITTRTAAKDRGIPLPAYFGTASNE